MVSILLKLSDASAFDRTNYCPEKHEGDGRLGYIRADTWGGYKGYIHKCEVLSRCSFVACIGTVDVSVDDKVDVAVLNNLMSQECRPSARLTQ